MQMDMETVAACRFFFSLGASTMEKSTNAGSLHGRHIKFQVCMKQISSEQSRNLCNSGI